MCSTLFIKEGVGFTVVWPATVTGEQSAIVIFMFPGCALSEILVGVAIISPVALESVTQEIQRGESKAFTWKFFLRPYATKNVNT